MSEVGQLIHRIECFRGAVHGGHHISCFSGHGPWLLGQGGILLALLPAIEPGKRPFVPDDLQGLAAFRSRPVAVGHHRDAAIDLDDMSHTRHGLGPVGVNALHFTAEHRWTGDDRREHAGQVDVEAKHRCAVDLFGGVQAFDWFADELKVLRVFEQDVLRRRQVRSALRQFAV